MYMYKDILCVKRRYKKNSNLNSLNVSDSTQEGTIFMFMHQDILCAKCKIIPIFIHQKVCDSTLEGTIFMTLEGK